MLIWDLDSNIQKAIDQLFAEAQVHQRSDDPGVSGFATLVFNVAADIKEQMDRELKKHESELLCGDPLTW